MKQEVVEKRHSDNSSGAVGVVLGILSIAFSGVGGILLGFVGFWFALNQFRHAKNKWASWGIALNIIGFVLGIVFAIYLYWSVGNSISGLQGAAGLGNYGA